MKYTMLTLFIAMLFSVSCSKDQAPVVPGMDTVGAGAVSKYKGLFMNGPYGRVTGSATIYKFGEKYQLKLDSFMSTNGPDLKVYLSKEVLPINFIKLGNLKSISGSQLYAIPGKPDFDSYRYALIHCEQFNHLFGSALLQ